MRRNSDARKKQTTSVAEENGSPVQIGNVEGCDHIKGLPMPNAGKIA
jgi:hypothetical protein